MARSGGSLFVAMLLGSAMIVAMSSWLNAAALAGSAAIEQHLSRAAEGYADTLDQAHANALAAQSLLPDIQLASERFARLADDERTSGALTGTTGSGTVVQLLTQMSNDLRGLGEEISASRETVKALYDQGSEHISRMRALVSGSGPVQQRADAFGEEAVALAGVITSLQQTSVAPAVRRAADDLAGSFIAPVADGDSEDLRTRQADGGRQRRRARSPRSRSSLPAPPIRSSRASRRGSSASCRSRGRTRCSATPPTSCPHGRARSPSTFCRRCWC